MRKGCKKGPGVSRSTGDIEKSIETGKTRRPLTAEIAERLIRS